MMREAVCFTVLEMKIFTHSSLAQSVEHLTVNQGVTGSSPVGGAKTKTTHATAWVVFVLLSST